MWHATIAAHFLLSKTNSFCYPLLSQTTAGSIPISVHNYNGDAFISMTQGQVMFDTEFTLAQRKNVVSALNIELSDLAPLPIQIVSTGHSKVIIPIRTRSVLDQLQPNVKELSLLSERLGCNGFFPFVLEGSRDQPVTYGRMFAPAIGIQEDPVTGNANGPTGAYLVQHDLVACENFIQYFGHQGISMHKPGKVLVNVSRQSNGMQVVVSGQAVYSGRLAYDLR